jgi:hypothetical protein
MERLKNIIKYEPETGKFFKITYGKWKEMKPDKHGRVKVKDGERYHASKLAWWFTYGYYPTLRGAFGYKDGNHRNPAIANLVPLWDTGEGLTQERIRDLFDYDSETGHLIRKYTMGGQKPGIADSMRNDGYYRVSIFGKRYLSHRIVWLWNKGYFPKKEIDHINHDRADNRIENLREVSTKENAQNHSAKRTEYRNIVK